MATFAPLVDEQPAQSFLGYSQGPGVQKWGTLFDGIGNTLGAVAGLKDEQNKTAIRKEAQAEVRNVQDIFGASAATDVAVAEAPGSRVIPPDLQQSADYVARLRKGMEQGTIKGSHYYGLLNSKLKEMRAKYPGYEDFVDATVQSVAGVDPANAVISSLRQEAEQEANKADAATRADRAYVDQNQEYIRLFAPDYWEDPSKYNMSQIRAGVATAQAQDLQVRQATAQLALEASQGTLNDKKLVDSAYKAATLYATQAMNGAYNAVAGPSWQEVQSTLLNAQKTGQSPSPEDTAKALGSLNQIKLGVVKRVNSLLLQEPYTALPDKERQNIIATATRQIDQAIEAYTNKDYGVLNLNAAWTKASQDQANTQILKDNPVLSKLPALRGMLGETAMGVFLTQTAGGKNVLDALSTVVIADKALGVATPDDAGLAAPAGDVTNRQDIYNPATYNKSSINDDMKSLTQYARDPSLGFNQKANNIYLDTQVGFVTQKKSPELAEKAARKIFMQEGGLNLSLVDESNYRLSGAGSPQDRVFAQLTSPDVTAAVRKLPSDVWQGYYRWALKSFSTRVEATGRDMSKRMDVYPGLKDAVQLYYDPKAGRIVGQLSNNLGPEPELTANARDVLLMDVRNLNVAMSGMKSLLDANGSDSAKEMEGLLKLVGVPLLPEGVEDKPGTQDGIDSLDPVVQKQIKGISDEQAVDYLTPRSTHGGDSITGLEAPFRSRITAMIQNAPPEIQKGLGLFSGFRSIERQTVLWNAALRKYGSAAVARKWVAPPGHSQHNFGKAADLAWNGKSLRHAPKEVIQWVHDHAKDYGLKFPLGNEVWHIEAQETRGGSSFDDANLAGDFASESDDDILMTQEDNIQKEATGITESGGPVGFFSGVFGGQDTPLVNNSNPRSTYPSDKDVEDFLASDPFYGQEDPTMKQPRILGEWKEDRRTDGYDGDLFSTSKKVPLPKRKPIFEEKAFFGELDDAFNESNSELRDMSPDTKRKVAKAALAINRIPIAAVGFDPEKFVLDVANKEQMTVAGAYNPEYDKIYSNTNYESNLVHESAHRGLELLRQKYPKEMEQFKNLDEETIVRWLIYSEAGDPETGSGPVADAQIEKAKMAYGYSDNLEKFKKIEELAQRYIKEKKPRGPR